MGRSSKGRLCQNSGDKNTQEKNKRQLSKPCLAASLVAGLATSVGLLQPVLPAHAGGFDRGGVNVDQLFDETRFDLQVSATRVFPQRNLENVVRGANIAAGFAPPGAAPNLTASNIDVAGDFTVPRVGLKFGLGDDVDCLASYSEPFGADAGYGLNNAYSATATEFSIDTEDYGLTCAYKFSAGTTEFGDAQLRVIGGVSYQRLDGFLARQTFLDFANLGILAIPSVQGITNTAGLGTFTIDGDAFGWRAGLAYEIPAIKLRAQVIYNSAYDYDLSGINDNSGFGVDPSLAFNPISMTTEIPQSIEAKFQTGINQTTLALFSFKWQDWSQLGIIPVSGVVSPVSGLPSGVSFDPLYQDGYTVSAGIGKVLDEKTNALVQLTWDRATSTIAGTQTDSWNLALGLSHKPADNVEIRVGGAIGLLEGGISGPTGGDPANNISYSFDPDFVGALNASIKFKF